MGLTQSCDPRRKALDEDLDDDDDGDAENGSGKNCFFFGRPDRPTDPFGPPEPDTPVHQRGKQERAFGNPENSVFLSKYSGLEKEALDRSSSSAGFDASYNNGATADIIHEGKDAEAKLNAKYQITEVLGVGSTSQCHRCIEKQTGRHFACKVVDKRLIEDRFQGMMEQFHTEIEALRSLHHPNIIQLYDVYISEDKIFIVMELMEGGELFDYVVQKGTLTEEEASVIVRKVTSALVYMHSKNIVHRDLKPENLLLRAVPRNSGDTVEVKIIDFGLSKCMSEPVARTFLGTRGYLAPEMLQRRDYNKAVDTWALGVIVFVLLCGCLPFDDDSQTVPNDDLVRSKFVLRFPRWAKNLSASAKDLLSHLLNVNPSKRYTAEQALNHPWVAGKTASKGSMLASPGRIRKSPILNKVRTPTNARPAEGGRWKKKSPVAGGGPSPRLIVRKTSI